MNLQRLLAPLMIMAILAVVGASLYYHSGVQRSALIPPSSASLTVTKVAPSIVAQGQVFSYSFTFSNPATSVGPVFKPMIFDQLDPRLSVVQLGPDCALTENNTVVKCERPGSTVLRTKTLSFTFSVKANQCGAAIPNTAAWSGEQALFEHPDQHWTIRGTTNTVTTQVQACSSSSSSSPSSTAPTLSLTKTAKQTAVTPGSILSYTLYIHNNSTAAAAKNVRIDDYSALVLQGSSFLADQSTGCSPDTSAGAPIIRCGGYDLPPGQTKVFFLNFRVNPSATCPFTFNNKAGAAADNATPVYTDNVYTPLQCPPSSSSVSSFLSSAGSSQAFGQIGDSGVIVSITSDLAVAHPGDVITYRIAVQNPKQDRVQNLQLENRLYRPGGGVNFRSEDSTTGCKQQDPRREDIAQCGPFNLDPGETKTFTIRYTTNSILPCPDEWVNAAFVYPLHGDFQDSSTAEVRTPVRCR